MLAALEIPCWALWRTVSNSSSRRNACVSRPETASCACPAAELAFCTAVFADVTAGEDGFAPGAWLALLSWLCALLS